MTSSGTIAEGTAKIAERFERNHSVPKRMLARPAGSASHPTGKLDTVSIVAPSQRSSGIVIATRYRFSGKPPAVR